MAFDLYLMGHGCYRPRNEFVNLPAGYSMHFYSEHTNGLPEREIQPILRGLRKPKRSYEEFRSAPNYTWQKGEPANWNFYVTGTGPDLRRRQGLSPRMEGPNEHLKLVNRGTLWDVRYVNFFKELANIQMSDEYTLKMLLEDPSALGYFADKTPPISIHVVLCTVVEMNKSWR